MDFFETLQHWEHLKGQVKHLQEQERSFREQLFAGVFPTPTEGVNEFTLPDGRVIKGTFKLNRKLDTEKLEELVKKRKVTAKVAERIQHVNISLDLAEYRELTEKQQAALGEAITTTPGLPTLELTYPAPEQPASTKGPDDPF